MNRLPAAVIRLLLCAAPPALPQEPDSLRAGGEAALEETADAAAERERAWGEVERLAWLLDNPMDLQTAGSAELEALPRVSRGDAAAFTAFRAGLTGPLTPEDLETFGISHPGFLRAVLPFTTWAGAAMRARPQSELLDLRSRFSRDLQPCAGMLTGAYQGSSLRQYHRLSAAPAAGVRTGGVLEKDAGEGYGHALYSAHVVLEDLPLEARIVAGDYRVSSGQGLLLGRSAAFGAASDPVAALSRSGVGLEPHRSASEARYLRGLGVVFTPAAGLRSTVFYSDRRIAASDAGNGCVASVDESGLFRTTAETARFNRLRMRAGGATVAWDAGTSLRIGGTVVSVALDPGIDPRDPEAFRGAAALLVSGDLRWRAEPLLVFGEGALARGGEGGVLAGGVLEAGLRTSIGLTLRKYSPGFWSPFGEGYAQWSETRNEEGVALAMETTPVRRLRVTAFVDLFRRPNASPSSPFVRRGVEQSVECAAQILRAVDLTVRCAMRSASDGITETDSLGRATVGEADRRKDRVRITLSYTPAPAVRVRGRGEWCFVRRAPGAASESGTLFWQDVRFAPGGDLTLEARIAMFDTPTYESRIAMMENDLPGVFSVPALYGRGFRWYLLVSFRPGRAMRVALRYAETRKEGVRSIGTGLQEIAGDTDNTLGVQVDLRF